MAEHVPSPWLVPFEGRFDASRARSTPPSKAPGGKRLEKRLEDVLGELLDEQRKLMAQNRRSLLVVMQGLDACGKDGTIRALSPGLDGSGCRVTSFKNPSSEELDHDFLWRLQKAVPERGSVGIFNRSHYEEVLIVKVQPEILEGQRLPDTRPTKTFWANRYESILDFEKHLARNGTTILKLWFNVSKDEQRKRFLDRIEESDSHWKFSADDVRKRHDRPAYLDAFSDALSATSRPWAPWYALPADDKPYLRLAVAELMLDALKGMELEWPKPSKDEMKEMKRLQKELMSDE